MTTRYPYLVSYSGNTFPCIDPGKLYSDRTAAPQDFWGRASSVTCPVGIYPGSAFFVVSRLSNDTMEMNETYSIKWQHEGGVTTWQKYVICRQWFIGVDGDGKSAALVELRDKRQLMLGAAQKSYNTRRHSGGTYSTSSTDVSQYYTDSLNAGALWTWQEVLADLWDELPSAIRGTAPTLAYIPQVKPQGLSYFGDAWEAVGDLLARCQSQLVYDPIADTFTVVRIGAAQNGLAAQVAALITRVEFDGTPRQNLQLASIPETIRFYFPKYGIPSQTAAGGQTVRPYYTIDKPSNLAGCQAGTVKPYRTSFHAVYNSQADADKANYPPANDTELQNLASELAEKIADKIDLGAERGRIIWNGIVPTTALALGSEVASIQWRDLGTDEGCVTESRTAESLPERQGPPIIFQPREALATPTLAVLNGTLAAASWLLGAGGTVLAPTSNPTSATATATIYALKPHTVAGQYKYQSIATNATVINPLPFSFTSGEPVRVAYQNGNWVALGLASRTIRHHSYMVSMAASSPSDNVDWTLLEDPSGIASVSGDTITITAPVTEQRFMVEWEVNLGNSALAATSHTGTVELYINSLAADNVSRPVFTVSGLNAAPTSLVRSHFTGKAEELLTQGDRLNLVMTISPGGTMLARDAKIWITPMFGSWQG